MTVAELVKALQGMPQDAIVISEPFRDDFPLQEVCGITLVPDAQYENEADQLLRGECVII